MKHLATAALVILLASPAAAFQCPADMAQIDRALPSASLSSADLAKVRQLRAQAEAQHKAGDHEASVNSLAQAKAILGL